MDRLFTNFESVCDVSAELLHKLQEAIADPDPETQLIGIFETHMTHKYVTLTSIIVTNQMIEILDILGEVFIQTKSLMEDVYKIYCYHHDEANALLKSYEGQEDIQQHFRTCISALKYEC